jgi:hypothetical protein
MPNRNYQIDIASIVGSSLSPSTGRTVKIIDATTSAEYATMTESPAGSGQYIATIAEQDKWAYYQVDGVIKYVGADNPFSLASGSVGGGGGSGASGFSGWSGISGASGRSGYSGSGVSGYSGYSGAQGTSGYSGPAGGASGYSGVSGYSGISGYSGYSGKSGYSGYSGYSGFSGPQGNIGNTGNSGYSGISGWSGYSGYSSVSGYSGISGYSGKSGYSGYSGFSGSGISGYSGWSGISGWSGYSGYSGKSGYSGYSGISGYSGLAMWTEVGTDVHLTVATDTVSIGTATTAGKLTVEKNSGAQIVAQYDSTHLLSFTVNSTGALTLVTTANSVITDSSFATSTYASQTTGWKITAAGAADFRYLFVDEMHAKAFIADLEMALAGSQIICKSVAKVAVDFVEPAPGDSGDLYVEEFAGYTGQVFANSDYVRLRQFTRGAGGSLTIADCWGTVSYVSRDASTKIQRYTYTRSAVGHAGGGSGTVPTGTLALDYGVGGDRKSVV